MLRRILLGCLLFSSVGYAGITCETSCRDKASVRYKYPCPTWSKPTRMCRGWTIEPHSYAACKAARETACGVRDNIYAAVKPQIKALLEPNFNADTWSAAVSDAEKAEYMAKCEAAGVAICAAIGAEKGGPWGAALGGATGIFVSYNLCRQSTRWD